ncbi:DNA-binding response regulator [Niastella yeongjuensis]|uniref:DNA-binding response regulator n=1 Tax=Niastella yeongjuensis TaxID=354355 RepID=A0A1V9E3R2_9BACT|nr:response regulator transcription factor [Niastella yeongjuensis]OQP40701.1 DNA-binding response regulator [Niastella yeongjuensis]SEP04205.1 two component transcriptional regulator, LuxR family [Niastella yeongjuensis]
MTKFLIADDHSLIRKGLNTLLREEYPGAEVREVTDSSALLQEAVVGKWDLIISDISMPGRNILETLKQLKKVLPHTPVLILSVHPEDQYVVRALKAGASGYLNKESAPEELLKAVRQLLQGKKYVSAEGAEKLAASFGDDPNQLPHEKLSEREFDVLKRLASGKTVSEIATTLSLSVNTISTYRSRILDKMNMANNAELTLYAVENKLI